MPAVGSCTSGGLVPPPPPSPDKGSVCCIHAIALQHPELQQQWHQGGNSDQAWRLHHRNLPEQVKVLQRLLELSLQFCIYTEAANLRHTPHALFLVYYVMRSSSKFNKVGRNRGYVTEWAHVCQHSNEWPSFLDACSQGLQG